MRRPTPSFTLGIEEEFQLVDPTTRELSPRNAEIIAVGTPILGDNIKPEMLMSCVETVTPICKNITEAREHLTRNRYTLAELAFKHGLAIGAAGTHPFTSWQTQPITHHERYHILEEELQDVIREILIFGMHVHVGIEDRDLAVQIMNELRYFLPHILALSTSSPFWMGRNTGLKSFRSVVFGRFPRTGIPEEFESFAAFDSYVQTLVDTHCIDDGKKIWWDVRPHPQFTTIEVRICDMPTRMEETLALAALIQAVCTKLYKLREQNIGWRRYSRALIMENKWRAVRYGTEGNMLDLGKQEEVSAHNLLNELLEFVDEVVDELGSRREIDYVRTLIKGGTSADRQLATFHETGDFKKVVDRILTETMEGL
ncbi:MAG: carboxylate-amine ligase [Chloroflexi bacterium]|uniref:Putative glutamate--cysteine ligase 2 n=1 Tax=Candidatus Chlorohelix allophototropha TaxID=3003348 RepID=A0A8T7LY98_9CHLR|nr:carboxylate-amine ligase [Chloroflexota bacterium]WJW66281.1 carboxylate-amine ligase [Chloroflexota bacterium L227-S17]